jgi:hypothetical protein
VTQPNHSPAERTRVAGRPIEAFNRRGGITTVVLELVRIGPPARPVSWSGTTFLITLSFTDDQHPEPVVISEEADNMWVALLEARAQLETHGWYLPIAGARADSWNSYAERRPEVAVVHRIGDKNTHEAFLVPAPPETIGTVAAQKAAWLQWLIQQAEQDGRS